MAFPFLTQYMRKWLLIFGDLMTAVCLFMLGPAPVLHIERYCLSLSLSHYVMFSTIVMYVHKSVISSSDHETDLVFNFHFWPWNMVVFWCCSMRLKLWNHLKTEILQLHKIDPFLLLFSVTLFMVMCMVGRMLLFIFFPSQFCGISCSAKQSSHFVLFSKFFCFINVFKL